MIPIAMIAGLAAPYLKQLVGTLMDAGCNLAANAISGGGQKAKEYIEEKTGISLDDPSKLSGNDMAEIAKLELDPDAAIKLKELSLEIYKEENRHEEATDQNWEDRISILANADASGSSTRPAIAKMMAEIVGFVSVSFSSALFIAIVKGDSNTISQLTNGWPLMLAVLGTPTALLRAYFAMRTKEKEARYNMSASLPPKPTLVDSVLNSFRKG